MNINSSQGIIQSEGIVSAEASQPTYLNRRRHLSNPVRAEKTRLLDYWDLMKPEISFLVGISALAGFFLGHSGPVDGWLLLHTLMGIILTAAGSGMLNHFLERHWDAQMRRTASRPLPSGRVSPVAVFVLGTLLVLIGTLQLHLLVNGLTAGLALLTTVLYLCVYTPLKRVSKYNTLFGCIPGALPALGGWTAATGALGAGGWALFAVLFMWQMPHFLALAWMYRKDYSRADFAMLPVVDPSGRSTVRQTLGFTLLLVLVSLLPYALDLSGMLYLVGVLVLGSFFIKTAVTFYRSRTNQDARRVLLASVLYIPLFVVCILLDSWVG